jgi:ribosomal protein S18 acetylase RimI-like enzyme
VPELSIAVYPEFRSSGVGSLLLGSLIARSRATEARGMSLSVARANPARALYVRHGFAPVQEDDPGGTGDPATTSETMFLEYGRA